MTNQQDKIAAALAKALEPNKKSGIGVTLNGDYMESFEQFTAAMKQISDKIVKINAEIEKLNGSNNTTQHRT